MFKGEGSRDRDCLRDGDKDKTEDRDRDKDKDDDVLKDGV